MIFAITIYNKIGTTVLDATLFTQLQCCCLQPESGPVHTISQWHTQVTKGYWIDISAEMGLF